MTSDEHIRRWSSMGDDVAAWIAGQCSGIRGPSLAVCLAGEDRALGKVALRMPGHASPATTCAAVRPSDHPVGELSYWIVPAARGQGLARPAVGQMMRRVAETTSLRSVVLDIELTNAVSRHLAERLGAERRQPPRTELDRSGVSRQMVVYVLPVG
jgi:RimJ/RimL family protein N-acetyltransferase